MEISRVRESIRWLQESSRKKFETYVENVSKELEKQRMNPEFRKKKERTLETVKQLHRECLAFTPLIDWVTRLNSYQLKNGWYILYGRKSGIDWNTVMLDDANYVKLRQVFVPANESFFDGTDMPEKLGVPRTHEDMLAVSKLAEFLHPYGAWTVCSGDW